MEDETLQILASSVFLRSNDTPLGAVATTLNLSRYDQAAASDDDHGNTFQNVHYYSDSEPSAPTFFNCRLENVDFVQCKFEGTEFYNLTLSNVTFLYVDCYNVTLKSLNLKNCIWKFAIAKNAVLVYKSTEDIGNTKITTLEPRNPLGGRHFEDSIAIATRRLTSVPLQTAMDIKRYENVFYATVRVLHTPRRGTLLVRLMDHKNIISQIIGHCVGEDNTPFTAYVHGVLVPKDQLTKDDRDRNDGVVTFRNRAEFNSANKSIHVFYPHTADDLCLLVLALLYASTVKPTMVCESFHGPFHRIQCTVSERHALKYDSSTTLVLHYHFEDGSGFVKTDDELWRMLMNYIHHDAPHLTSMHLMIGKGFWRFADWRLGAVAVLKQTSLRNSNRDKEYPNFLANIAKIAAPADRWMDHTYRKQPDYDKSKDLDYSSHGTALQITIDGTESEEQQDSVRDLEKAIHDLRTARPLFRSTSDYEMVYTREDEGRKGFRWKKR